MFLLQQSYQPKFDEKLQSQFFNTYKSFNHNNKFILLLLKGVYPYEYMDDWEKSSETSLPEKEDFYSHLNMGDITDADYAYSKRVYKDFEINLGEYPNLYIQRDTLLLADVFESFQNVCLKIDVFENFRNVLKYINSILQNFIQHLD